MFDNEAMNSQNITSTTVEIPDIQNPSTATIIPIESNQENSSNGKSSIKLPGGATLVAVTDRNAADLLLNKPKQLEKPHVTITIGDKPLTQPLEPPMMTAIMQTPTAQIPLNIPLPVPQNVVKPPPLHQLSALPIAVPTLAAVATPAVTLSAVETSGQLTTSGNSQTSVSVENVPQEDFIPLRIRQRLDELGMTDQMFSDLLIIYESVREEYIELLKKGFLVFFPYLIGKYSRTPK